MSNDATADRRPLRKQYRDDFRVRSHTRRVVEHHQSTSNPDKPLQLLIPGALAAVAFLTVMALVAWETWGDHQRTPSDGLAIIAVLMPFYAASVYVFALGYELYDHAKALRLTLLIVIGTVAIVLIVAVLAALLSGDRDSKDSSKSSSKSSSGGEFAGRFVVGAVDAANNVGWTSWPAGAVSDPGTNSE